MTNPYSLPPPLMASPPTHIDLPSPLLNNIPPLDSPDIFFTAPSSPLTDPPLNPPSESAALVAALRLAFPPSNTIPPPPTALSPPIDDAFPTGADVAIDLALDDEGLSPLEKIYLFSRSKASFHRVFITHTLPSFLDQVTPLEAIEYVLPLLGGLAMDQDEAVKEALANNLVAIIWWFFSHCQLVPDDAYPASSHQTLISVQAFTPILGTLLLSPNAVVGGAARFAVVALLSRMQVADRREGYPDVGDMYVKPRNNSSTLSDKDSDDDDDADEWVVGLFGHDERQLFEHEILQQVVIGMGRLDVDNEGEGDYEEEDDTGIAEDAGLTEDPQYQSWIRREEARLEAEPQTRYDRRVDSVNPYFPVLAPPFSLPSPASSTSSTPESATDTSSSSSSSPSSASSIPSPARSSPSPHTQPYPRSPLHIVDPEPMPLPAESIFDRNRLLPESEPPLQRESLSAEWVPHAPRLSQTTPPTQAQAPPSRSSTSGSTPSPPLHQTLTEPDAEHDIGEDEQAAVGRLSSMSLMAAVAASGTLGEETKQAFVKEVERVGRDPVYWVRREASFALGALAKIVPEELVLLTLSPLFQSLRQDPVWHVRHSAMFALPAILSRLNPPQRRSLALTTILPLIQDDSAAVRSGVLEALGEVVYTFHKDEEGPPEQLVQLFLGRREDKRVRDGQQVLNSDAVRQTEARQQILNSIFGQTEPAAAELGETQALSPLESFYQDPARPLICAFNFPAVAYTLGQGRWGELREAYLELAQNRAVKVRRTLAASLGELAKIVGPEHARRDLMGVWWDAIRSGEEEVREKAIECVEMLVRGLGSGSGDEEGEKARWEVVQGLLSVWWEGGLFGWREREAVARTVGGLAEVVGLKRAEVIRGLVRKGLEDNVAAVREATVAALGQIWITYADQTDVLDDLQRDIHSLAQDPSCRRRMTFVACQQALVLPQPGRQRPPLDPDWTSLELLIKDPVVGVRIALARLIGALSAEMSSTILRDLVHQLQSDPSHEVKSYVSGGASRLSGGKHTAKYSTFSRPPSWPPNNNHRTLTASQVDHSGNLEQRDGKQQRSTIQELSQHPAAAQFESTPSSEVGVFLFPSDFKSQTDDGKMEVVVPG